MRQVLILFLLLQQMAAAADRKTNSHVEELNAVYPYGLLTDDYGVLDLDDLKINTCIASPSPLSKANISYPYWQCFEVKNSKLVCEGNTYDPDQKTRVALQVFSGVRNGELHEFLAGRTWPLESCNNNRKNWKKLTAGEKYICISGQLISKESKDGKIRWFWNYRRYKTKKGCDSYFADECDVQQWVSKGHCPSG